MFTDIEKAIEEVEKCVQQMTTRQKKILSSPFHKEDDHHELDKLTAKIQSSLVHIWTRLKASKQSLAKGEGSQFGKADIRMKMVQLDTMAQKFVDVLGEYGNVQIEYKDKKKRLLKKQLEITGQNVKDEDLEKMLDTTSTAIFTQDYIAETRKAREGLFDVKGQYSELLKIENNLREINDMMLNMSILINSQGEFISSIEKNIVQAADNVQSANKAMGKAARKKRRICKKKIILFVVLISLVLFLLALIVYILR